MDCYIGHMFIGNPPFADQDPMRALFLIPRSPPTQLEGQQYSKPLQEFVAVCLNDDPHLVLLCVLPLEHGFTL